MLVTQGLEDIVVSDDPVFTAEYSIPAGVGYDFYAWQERSLLGIQVKSTSSIEKKKNIRRTLSQYEKDLQSMYVMQEHIHNVRVQSMKSTQSMIVHNLAHTSGFSKVDCMNRAYGVKVHGPEKLQDAFKSINLETMHMLLESLKQAMTTPLTVSPWSPASSLYQDTYTAHTNLEGRYPCVVLLKGLYADSKLAAVRVHNRKGRLIFRVRSKGKGIHHGVHWVRWDLHSLDGRRLSRHLWQKGYTCPSLVLDERNEKKLLQYGLQIHRIYKNLNYDEIYLLEHSY